MAMEPPTSAADQALLLPHPLAVVAFVISQALFDSDFSLTIPSVIMRLQHSHRQRSILSQFVMKRAQINLWLFGGPILQPGALPARMTRAHKLALSVEITAASNSL